MKRKVFLTTLLMLILSSTTSVPEARAQSCKSMLQTAGDIWKKWGDEIIAAGCVAANATVTAGTLGASIAATAAASQECIRNADKYKKAAEAMLRVFNSLADNGPATIGPRRIEFGKIQEGNILGPGDRTYISVYPMDKDSVTFKIKKLDGKCRTEVIICKIDANGKVTNLSVFEFDNDAPDGKEVTKTVTGVQNHLVQVRLNGATVLRRFIYQFKATK